MDMLEQIQSHLARESATMQKLCDRIARLEADLFECKEYLERHSDVVDGDYGQPAPNEAMRLISMIDQSLGEGP